MPMPEETRKFFQKYVIEPAEALVELTGNAELRVPLRKLYVEKVGLEAQILNARYLEDLTESIEKRAIVVQEEMGKFKNAKILAVEISKAKQIQKLYSKKEEILKLRKEIEQIGFSEDYEASEEIDDFVLTGQQVTDSFLEFNEDLLKTTELIGEAEVYAQTYVTEKSLRKFKRRNIFRKVSGKLLDSQSP